MSLHLQPVRIATGSDDTDSQLVFSDDFLVAILVQLSVLHDDDAGMWFLETGFGRVSTLGAPLFASLGTAQAWINQRLDPGLVRQ